MPLHAQRLPAVERALTKASQRDERRRQSNGGRTADAGLSFEYVLTIPQVATPGGSPRESVAVGAYSLGTCPKELGCYLYGYFPFELGVPFAIDLNGIVIGFPPMGGGGFYAGASLQLYETPSQDGDLVGAPVQINLIPEPSSAGLAFTGPVIAIVVAAPVDAAKAIAAERSKVRIGLPQTQKPRMWKTRWRRIPGVPSNVGRIAHKKCAEKRSCCCRCHENESSHVLPLSEQQPSILPQENAMASTEFVRHPR